MGKNQENPWVTIDEDPTAGIIYRFSEGGFTELSATEMSDLLGHSSTQTAFDNWWAARPTAQANWYAGHSSTWKAAVRDAARKITP